MARKKGNSKKDFITALILTSLAVFVFVAVYYVKNPKNIFRSKAAVGEKRLVTTCGSLYDWDPSKTFIVNLDDSDTGPLTDQYVNYGPYFDYNMYQGVGLNKVSVNNSLNPGNGYATTITPDTPFPDPINVSTNYASTTESSMVLNFPSPVETVSFQMQYGEPFDLLDVDREVPTWGVDVSVYVRENDGSDSFALGYKWDVTPVAYENALRDICFTVGWNKLIGKVVIMVPDDPHARTGALPPEKLSFDNFKVEVPDRWEPAEVTPAPSTDEPGTCVCLPNGKIKYDYCNNDYGYAPVCGTDGCECVR